MNPTSCFGRGRRWRCLALAIVLPAFAAAAAPLQAADVAASTHAQLSQLSGMYKVASASDPLFPTSDRQEWFLDFGKGTTEGRNHGKLAVSVRQNPNVRVRILVWQFVPETGQLLIGNQTAPGEGRAVMLASWNLRRATTGLVLERGDYRATLRPADPGDY